MPNEFLSLGVIFLGAALVFVPIAKRLGIGSVLGYLLGGVIIGPYVLGFLHEGEEEIMHAAEFGVVMMLFLIGLELNPQSLWKMRNSILGLGLSQMLLTAVPVGVAMLWGAQFGLSQAVVVGLAFAMSSTAIVLQTLKEKGLNNTAAGHSAFSVLLLQDIAVIPILALIPLLAYGELANDETANSPRTTWASTLTILAVLAGIYLAGRFLINPFLRFIGRVRMRELFTAAALFIVIGVAYLMESIGMSAALGTFMAGVMLANSAYRHELESDIEPFKGMLLGIFFTAVGATIDFNLLAEHPWKILSLVTCIICLKAGVLAVIGRFAHLRLDQNILFALLLAQVGEFAYVVLNTAKQYQLLEQTPYAMLTAVTTISMALSPMLLFINERFIDPVFGVKLSAETPEETAQEEMPHQHPVIIAGFGHFGSMVGRFLRANGVDATVLDSDSDRVDLLRKMGFEVYYGDATRLDLLKAAGAENAKLLVCAIDDREAVLRLVDTVHKHFPHLQIFMRAHNRLHAYEMYDLGLEHVYREHLHTSIQVGVDVLKSLGGRSYTALRKAQEFIRHDEEALKKLGKERHNKERYILMVREEIAQQEKVLAEDNKFLNIRQDSAWDSEPLKEEST
ncbi:MAG: monovalent cation:proton antiporter-2 (CPA2) family protein [Saprospiraceae bacterium]|nr:monovalent cation:proton antiporter-2 (CPA2) family protein [Saprospiraceae bacterium]